MKARSVRTPASGEHLGMGIVLPFAPKGLSRLEAARHVGVSPTTFDAMVKDGRMPRPKTIGSRVLWDRLRVEAHFDALPDQGGSVEDDSFADWQ